MKYKPLVHALWLEKIKEGLAQCQNTDATLMQSLLIYVIKHTFILAKVAGHHNSGGDEAGEKGPTIVPKPMTYALS